MTVQCCVKVDHLFQMAIFGGMRFFHEKSATINVGGKNYEMEIMEIPSSSFYSVEIKELGKFTLIKVGGKFLCYTGEGMTPELLQEITDYIFKHA